MTSDRGLCGGFNTNLIKATERFVKREKAAEAWRWRSSPSAGRAGTISGTKAEIIPGLRGRLEQIRHDAIAVGRDVIPPF